MSSIAYILQLYISASYVVPLYTTSKDSLNFKTKRDDPRIIMMRMKRLSLMMSVNLILIPSLETLLGLNEMTVVQNFLNLGLLPGFQYSTRPSFDIHNTFEGITKSLWLVSLLFVGPLSDNLIYYFLRPRALLVEFRDEFWNLWSFRNFCFAPLTEEIFYTSMLLNIYLATRDHLSWGILLWQPSLFFGIAHAHHAYESYQSGEYTLPAILVSTIFQVTYTTLFGALTNFIYISSGGNTWACIALHSFCNILGFPSGSKIKLFYTVIEKPKARWANIIVQLWGKCYFVLLLIGLILFKDNIKAFKDQDTCLI